MTTQATPAGLFVVEPFDGDSAFLFASERTLGEVAAELALRFEAGGTFVVKPLIPTATSAPATPDSPHSHLSLVRQ